jgi:hypothetical protein
MTLWNRVEGTNGSDFMARHQQQVKQSMSEQRLMWHVCVSPFQEAASQKFVHASNLRSNSIWWRSAGLSLNAVAQVDQLP